MEMQATDSQNDQIQETNQTAVEKNEEKNAKDNEPESETTSSMILLGGRKRNNHYTDNVYILEPTDKTIQQIRLQLPEIDIDGGTTQQKEAEWSHLGMAYVQNQIYIFGGMKCSQNLSCCYKLEADGTWKKMADMTEARSEISNSSVVYKDEICVMDGSDGENLKTVEKYNPEKDEWVKMPDLNIPMSNAAATICRGKIYVCGENSLEYFDEEQHKWQTVTNFVECAKSPCLLTHSIDNVEYLCALGESNSRMNLDDEEQKWEPFSNFNENRQSFAAVQFDSKIYVFGGFVRGMGNFTRLDSVEVFDGEKWTISSKMPDAMSGFAYSLIPKELGEALLQAFPL